ncbi:ankyrin repeat domain-containing protein [Cohnella sp. GCM10012308]|uniref:ankyrin repeat domain-containing protein n=1 Tax=Cohnella sp. GCM10012308 TaxID=3317329 RepID=UPI00361CC0F5
MPAFSRVSRMVLTTAAALLITAALPISVPRLSAAPASAATVTAAKQQLTLQLQTIRLYQVMMVPARAFFQGVGARFQVQGKSFSATLGNHSLSGTIGSPQASVDGKAMKLPYSPKVIKGTLYIPLQLAAGLLDYDSWRYDEGTRKLTFSYSKKKLGELAASLHNAAKKGNVKLLQELLDKGVEVNAKVNGYSDWTALDYAIMNHEPSAAKLLLERGGTYKPVLLVSPLLYPGDKQTTDTLEVLLEHGLDPNLWISYMHANLLELACMKHTEIRSDASEVTTEPSYEVVRLLLAHGAKVTTDALYHAAGAGSYEIVQELLRHGGDPDQRSSFGATPREVARFRGVEQWLVRDAGQSLAPLVFRTAEGTELEEGTVQLRRLAGPGSQTGSEPLSVSVSFSKQAYVKEGSYQPEFVTKYGKGWVLHRQPAIDIQGGTSGPAALQLPRLNAKVRLVTADPAHWTGALYVTDAASGQGYLFQPAEGVFELYLPPGKFFIDMVRPGRELTPSASAVSIEIKEDQLYYEIPVPVTENN